MQRAWSRPAVVWISHFFHTSSRSARAQFKSVRGYGGLIALNCNIHGLYADTWLSHNLSQYAHSNMVAFLSLGASQRDIGCILRCPRQWEIEEAMAEKRYIHSTCLDGMCFTSYFMNTSKQLNRSMTDAFKLTILQYSLPIPSGYHSWGISLPFLRLTIQIEYHRHSKFRVTVFK